MNLGQARTRLVQGGAALATAAFSAALLAGCGSNYRPVVTPVTPSGPAAQPSSYAIVVSAPSTTTPGIATVIDYSGDSVLALAPIGPGPLTFTIDELGGNGYTINSDGTLSNFPISSNLQAKQVNYTTVPSTAQLVNLFSPSAGESSGIPCPSARNRRRDGLTRRREDAKGGVEREGVGSN